MGRLKLTRLDDAVRRLHEVWRPRPRAERVSLGEALGRVLAEDVYSPMDLPPFDRSAVDGYAVRAEDTYGADEESPIRLRLKMRVQIGVAPSGRVERGECAYVTTGSMIPEGADAVVMVEYTRTVGDVVEVYRPVVPGENVVSRGCEARRGQLVLRRGCLLNARRLGLLASMGLPEVEVYARPRVSVISTGPELVEPGRPLRPGEVYDVNTTTVSSMAREEGAQVEVMGVVPDDEALLAERVLEALERSDMVLVSGGTSKGDVDVTPRAIARLPGSMVVAHGLALKPGKPTLIAVIDGKPVIGLPGNPTSSMLVFRVLVRPLIWEMQGATEHRGPVRVKARASVRMASAKGRREYKLGVLEPGPDLPRFKPLPTGSEVASTYAMADGYVVIPEEVEMIDEGEVVEVELL